MWEWSNQKHQKGLMLPYNDEASSLLSAYDDLLNKGVQPSSRPFGTAPSKQDLENQRNIAEMEFKLQRKLKEYHLDSFNLKIYSFHPQTWETQTVLYQELLKIRNIFLKRLAYTQEENCYNLGLRMEEINLLKQGITPENLNVHIKIPFDFDGKPELNNLCLIKAHPTHENIHKIIDIQLNSNFLRQQKKLFIPICEGEICYD